MTADQFDGAAPADLFARLAGTRQFRSPFFELADVIACHVLPRLLLVSVAWRRGKVCRAAAIRRGRVNRQGATLFEELQIEGVGHGLVAGVVRMKVIAGVEVRADAGWMLWIADGGVE